MNQLERTASELALGDLADDARVREHFDGDRWNFAAILRDNTWSTGERAAIRIAFALWNGYYADGQLGELFSLDADSFDRVLRAIAVRYHGVGTTVRINR